MATLRDEVGAGLEKLAEGFHIIRRAAEAAAPEAAALTPLAAKVMALVSAGNPLSAGAEALLMGLVDVVKLAESHGAIPATYTDVSPPPAPASSPSAPPAEMPPAAAETAPTGEPAPVADAGAPAPAAAA